MIIYEIYLFKKIIFRCKISTHYDTIIEAIPYIWNGLLVLNVTSIIMGFVYRKKQDFNVIQYIISQLLIIFLWVLFYVSNLVG